MAKNKFDLVKIFNDLLRYVDFLRFYILFIYRSIINMDLFQVISKIFYIRIIHTFS